MWSNSFSYEASSASRIPRRLAVSAGNLVRCGLFGASTYSKPLPDPILTDYLQFCHNLWTIDYKPTKGLHFAHKVVAAAPGFSWGWSAVEIAAATAMVGQDSGPEQDALHAEALRAADTAVRLDPSNSEALAYKGMLLDQGDLLGREALMRRALKARPLACGCEHHFYGSMLVEAGRINAAIDQFRQSTDVVALDFDSQWALGEALLIAGRPAEAKQHLDAALDLSTVPSISAGLKVAVAALDGDYASAVDALQSPDLHAPTALMEAIIRANKALTTGSPRTKTEAAAALAALPPRMQSSVTVTLLGALGANAAALKAVEAAPARTLNMRKLLFYPSMAGARADPAFPAAAQRLGLMNYWRKTRTRPDFCAAKDAPPVCRII